MSFTVYLNINATDYGDNFTSGIDMAKYDFTTFATVDELNDTSTAKNVTANLTVYMQMDNAMIELVNATWNITGYNSSGNPKNINIDTENDGNIDVRLPGTLYANGATIDSFNDSNTAKNFTVGTNGGTNYSYIEVPAQGNVTVANITIKGHLGETGWIDEDESYYWDWFDKSREIADNISIDDAVDESWTTYFEICHDQGTPTACPNNGQEDGSGTSVGTGYFYENISVDDGADSGTIQTKIYMQCLDQAYTAYDIDIWDYSTNDWADLNDSNYDCGDGVSHARTVTNNMSFDYDNIENGSIRLRTMLYARGESSLTTDSQAAYTRIYESRVNY